MEIESLTNIFAFITQTDEVAGLFVGGGYLPLVFTDRSKLNSMRLVAQVIANDSQQPVRLWRYQGVELIETVWPQ